MERGGKREPTRWGLPRGDLARTARSKLIEPRDAYTADKIVFISPPLDAGCAPDVYCCRGHRWWDAA